MDDLPNYSYYDRATQESNIASGTTLGGKPVTNFITSLDFSRIHYGILETRCFCATLRSNVRSATLKVDHIWVAL
jgi:hypothetical protein